MAALERPFLIETTRLISRSWTGRLSTGIDRVCDAYLSRFKSRAQAVVQHRGVVRVLCPQQSDRLFAMLQGPLPTFRKKFMRFVPGALASSASRVDGAGAVYLNASHTDFDLDEHINWVRSSGLRPVYFLHDLIPLTHTALCRPHAVRRHLGRVTMAARNAAGIIVNSHSTARDFQEFVGDQRECLPPVLVAPLSGARLLTPPAPSIPESGLLPEVGGAVGPERPYFVCVGTIEPRKNHVLLLQAWRRLVKQLGKAAPRLVIIGQWGKKSGSVRDALASSSELKPFVEVITGCGDKELGHWVAGAQALLLPTLAEGYGLPMVEALEIGTPVIASDLPCFRETGQGIPLLLSSNDPADWAQAIRSFCSSQSDRERQLKMMHRFRPFTWNDHFSHVEPWLATLPHAALPTFQDAEVPCLSA